MKKVGQTKRCQTCGKVFERDRTMTRWKTRKFCSRLCAWEGQRVPRELCACGCGEQVSAPRSRWKPGHNASLQSCHVFHVWATRGKTRWYVRKRKGFEPWARVVMQNHIRRELRPEEVVHHINGDSTDDRIENLRLYPNHAAHMRDEYLAGNLHSLNPNSA